MIYTDCKVGQLVTLKRGDNFGKLNNMDSETWTILSECGVYKIIRLSNHVDGRVKISSIVDPTKMFFVRPASINLFRLDVNNVDDDCVYDSSEDDEEDEREKRDVQDESDVRDESGKVDEQKLSNDKLNVKITYTINLPENHKTTEEIGNFIVAQTYAYLIDRHCSNALVEITKCFEKR